MSSENILAGSLGRKGLTISFAESITGGLISHLLTNVPGSSSFFIASYVVYSNEAKIRSLNIKRGTIEEHGAVSEETAREMAIGARNASGSDIAVAVTGIAGPTGATQGKPIGLVYFALANGNEVIVDKVVFKGDRSSIKEQAAEHAILMAIDDLEKKGSKR